MYAFITGDEITKFEPLAVVFNNGKFEFICESNKRQASYYDYVNRTKPESLEDFTKTFSYQKVETGEVTPDVESMLNKLRARFALSQVAEQELEADSQQNDDNDRQVNALLRISKRMRTGANER